MRLGIDFDGTSFDFQSAFLKFFNNRNGMSVTTEDITRYEWYDCVEGITEELFYETLTEFNASGGWNDVHLYPGVAEALAKAAEVHLLYGVTVRTGHGPQAAEQKLRAAGVPMVRISTPKPGETKAHVCTEAAIDILFEDRPRYCVQVATAGIPVVCINQRYNKLWQIPKDLPIFRATSLVEGIKNVESFAKDARKRFQLGR